MIFANYCLQVTSWRVGVRFGWALVLSVWLFTWGECVYRPTPWELCSRSRCLLLCGCRHLVLRHHSYGMSLSPYYKPALCCACLFCLHTVQYWTRSKCSVNICYIDKLEIAGAYAGLQIHTYLSIYVSDTLFSPSLGPIFYVACQLSHI